MKQRLLALDVLRGLTIGGMILVNSPGTWNYVYPPLLHSPWNGLTAADVIFPLFLFMMGMSMYISLKKFSFRLHRELFLKIIRRTFLIFIIGTGIYATATFLGALRFACLDPAFTGGNPWKEAFASLAHVRILGVLQRLALCYGIGSLLVTTVRHRYIPYLAAALLIGYVILSEAKNLLPVAWLRFIYRFFLRQNDNSVRLTEAENRKLNSPALRMRALCIS